MFFVHVCNRCDNLVRAVSFGLFRGFSCTKMAYAHLVIGEDAADVPAVSMGFAVGDRALACALGVSKSCPYYSSLFMTRCFTR